MAGGPHSALVGTGRPTAVTRRRPCLLIVGSGRAATAIARGLGASNSYDLLIWGRDADAARRVARLAHGSATAALADGLARADGLLLATSDQAIAPLATRLAAIWPHGTGPTVALHMAGAWPSTQLAPLRTRTVAIGVFHPLLPLVGTTPHSAAVATISGDPRAQRVARRLARSLGMRAVTVDDRHRALLHWGAMVAAADVTALLAGSIAALQCSGLSVRQARAAALGLASAALANLRRSPDPLHAVTGPAVRGDVETLRHHAVAWSQLAPEWSGLIAAHRQLAALGATSARRRKLISAETYRLLLAALGLPASRAPRTLPARRATRRGGSR